MIHKRLAPEERRGVLAIIIIALLIILLGFCHRCVSGTSTHNESVSVRNLVEGDERSGYRNSEKSDSTQSYEYDEDGKSLTGMNKSRGNKGKKRGGAKVNKKNKAGTSRFDTWSERDYLNDTIP